MYGKEFKGKHLGAKLATMYWRRRVASYYGRPME